MAELALGVIGVIGPIYKGTIGAINFILDIKNVHKDHKYLILSLRLEEKRFYSWGEHVGLVVDDPETNTQQAAETASKLFGEGQRGMTFDVLAQIQILFEDFRKQQIRHGRLQEDGAAGQMPIEALESEDEVLSVQRKNFLKSAWTKATTKTMGGWKRYRWVEFDKRDVETLIGRFTALNDKVTGLLDSKLQREIAITTQDTYREVLQLATRLDQFQQIVGATRFSGDIAASHGKEMSTLLAMARFKFFHGYIEDNQQFDDRTLESVTQKGTRRQQMRIPVEDITIENSAENSNRTKGIYCPKRGSSRTSPKDVWIEWKTYENRGSKSGPSDFIIDRAEKLSNLLNRPDKPAEFRVPRCLGYFNNGDYRKAHPRPQDGSRGAAATTIGFVYLPPKDTDMRTLPKSLLDLLQANTGAEKPTITERIALAHALASSLMFLHTVDWLHKGLRSDHVIFFTPSAENLSLKMKHLALDPADAHTFIDYRNPLLSGFDYARPAKFGENTESPNTDVEVMMYLHPESQVLSEERKPYCKTFDIYSLGVILVEIAFWMPIDQVVAKYDLMKWKKEHPKKEPGRGDVFKKEHAVQRPAQTKLIREKLLKREPLRGVGAEMGSVYQKVVQTCLEGGASLGLRPNEDETKPSVGAKLGNTYYEKVVRQLEEVKI